MTRIGSLIVLLLSLGSCVNSRDEAKKVASFAGRPCATGDSLFFAKTALSEREDWYAQQQRAAGERPLCAGVESGTEVYRLDWIPTFHPTLTVRIERNGATISLLAKRLSGAGGYEPGHVAQTTNISLSESDWRDFTQLLKTVDYWDATPLRSGFGVDGAQWVLEGVKGGSYRVFDRWTPQREGFDGRYRRLAEWMIARSRLVADSLVREY